MNFDTELYVSQMIPTVQGEGNFTGVPSLLIRLLGCNLHCDFCDSKYTWSINNGLKTYYDNDIESLNTDIFNIIHDYNIHNLMITGGEPTLYTKNPLFNQLLDHSAFETTEIETNGIRIDQISKLEDVYLNISPKLNIRYYKNTDDYSQLIKNIKWIQGTDFNYTLKFVDDNRENIFNFLEDCDIDQWDYDTIRIMPKTKLRQDCDNKLEFMIELEKSNLETLKFCMKYGFIYTPRVHLYLFKDEKENIK